MEKSFEFSWVSEDVFSLIELVSAKRQSRLRVNFSGVLSPAIAVRDF